MVTVIRQRVVRCFVRPSGRYHEHAADEDGILRSIVFPGLWLDVAALLQLDGQQVLDTLRQGVAIPEYAA